MRLEVTLTGEKQCSCRPKSPPITVPIPTTLETTIDRICTPRRNLGFPGLKLMNTMANTVLLMLPGTWPALSIPVSGRRWTPSLIGALSDDVYMSLFQQLVWGRELFS